MADRVMCTTKIGFERYLALDRVVRDPYDDQTPVDPETRATGIIPSEAGEWEAGHVRVRFSDPGVAHVTRPCLRAPARSIGPFGKFS